MDRSLTPAVALALDRFPEIHAVHMKDVYEVSERVPDTQWLADIGDANWIGVTQNFKIPLVAVERQTIERHRTRVYSLSKADYSSLTQGLLFGRAVNRLLRAARITEPGFWRISHEGVLRDI